MQPVDETAEPWLCACGKLTLVTHWAWPNGVAVHDPELAYLEAAGIAEQGNPVQSGASGSADQGDKNA